MDSDIDVVTLSEDAYTVLPNGRPNICSCCANIFSREKGLYGSGILAGVSSENGKIYITEPNNNQIGNKTGGE